VKSTIVLSAAFLGTVPAANWLIGNVGTVCVPHGPCLVPVLPGLMAPSGVLMIGVAMVLRDILRESIGLRGVVALVLLGAFLSLALAPQQLALASVAAFALAELADTAVYEPLRRRGMALAVLGSGIAGAVVDSVLFLSLAFGSLDFLAGQVVGKLWAAVAAAAFIGWRRAK
jgi:uncharacterized PurR-regulated membrane protein YhhQ (DUF165 family)